MTLWCLYEDCGIGYASTGTEDRPAICPGCDRPEWWTTHRWELTFPDKRFLKKIGVEWRETE